MRYIVQAFGALDRQRPILLQLTAAPFSSAGHGVLASQSGLQIVKFCVP
jgi:hypothetical protein